MSENSRLKIHTNARPTLQTSEAVKTEQEKTAVQTVLEKEAQSAPAEPRRVEVRRERRRSPNRRERAEQPMTKGEKLIRNTAVACALLLTVMALKNVDQPWSRQATEGIRQAMTMRVDWDETLGKLSFVRAIVPDTALVFLNMGEGRDLIAPTNGEVTHAFDEAQPWIEYHCAAGEAVCAASDGTVTAAGQGAGGEWIVLIEREDGTETVYGYMAQIYVKAGDTVQEGQQIGATAEQADSRLYFELRENGNSVDPTGRMK